MPLPIPDGIQTTGQFVPPIAPGDERKLPITQHFLTVDELANAQTGAAARERQNIAAGYPCWKQGQQLIVASEPAVYRSWTLSGAQSHARLATLPGGKQVLLDLESNTVQLVTTDPTGGANGDIAVNLLVNVFHKKVNGAWTLVGALVYTPPPAPVSPTLVAMTSIFTVNFRSNRRAPIAGNFQQSGPIVIGKDTAGAVEDFGTDIYITSDGSPITLTGFKYVGLAGIVNPVSGQDYFISCYWSGGEAYAGIVTKPGDGGGTDPEPQPAAYRFGFYTNNPTVNSESQQQEFLNNYDEWKRITGVRPRSMNFFLDFAQPNFQWAADGEAKVQAMVNTGADYLDGTDVLLEFGIGPCEKADGNLYPGHNLGHDEAFAEILAGNWDTFYFDTIKRILDRMGTGHFAPVLHIRIGYEFNGGFMPWSPANSGKSTRFQEFIDVFKRIADRCRAAQAAHAQGGGVNTIKIVWNPTAINYNSGGIVVEDLYPGNDYVDIVSLDSYGKMYPRDLTDWRTGNSQMSNFAAWSVIEENVKHYLSWNDATQSSPHGDGGGCSAERLAQFAMDHSKPFALSECGCGNNDINVGPIDNYWYPEWLKEFLDRWTAAGLVVTNVNSWATDQADGGWGYVFGQRPKAAKAWAEGFGVIDATGIYALRFTGADDGQNYGTLGEDASYRVTTQVLRLEHRGTLTSVSQSSTLIAKWDNGDDSSVADHKEYLFARSQTGTLFVAWRTSSGIAIAESSVADGVASGALVTRAVEVNPVSGLAKFYLSSDGTNFTQLGSDRTASSPGAIAGTSNRQEVTVGRCSGLASVTPMAGDVYSVKAFVGGTKVIDAKVDQISLIDSVLGTRGGRGYYNGTASIVKVGTSGGGTSPVAPGAPTISAGTPASDSVPVNATAPTTGDTPTVYSWEKKLASDGSNAWAVAGTTSNLNATPDFTFSGLTGDTAYNFRARAQAQGTAFGPYSNVLAVSTAAPAEATPAATYTFDTDADPYAPAGSDPDPAGNGGAWKTASGKLLPKTTNNSRSEYIFPDVGAPVKRMTADITLGLNATPGPGLVLQHDNYSSQLVFEINWPDQSIKAIKFGLYGGNPLTGSPLQFASVRGNTYNLDVRVTNSVFDVYVDNTLIGSLTDSGYPTATKCGVKVGDNEGPGTAFDNVKVYTE